MKTCPVCQKVVTDQAKFCFFCGASLLDAEVEPIVPTVDPEPESAKAPIPETFESNAFVMSESEPAPEPVPEPEPVYMPEPAPISEPEPVFAPEPAPMPEPAPIYAPEPAPIPDPKQVYKPEPAPAPEPEPVHTPEPAPAPEPEPVHTPEPAPVEPKQEQPIIVSTDSRSLMTTPGYIFTTILFHIPVIGLIFMIVWGCGKTKNLSRKRFSLACLIMRLLGYIVVLSAAVFLLICFSGKFPILTEAFAKFFS